MLNNLRNLLYRPPQIPKTIERFGSYESNFCDAIRFTKSCGFAVEEPKWRPEDKLDTGGGFLEPALRAAGVSDVSKSALQCLKWSHYLAPYIERQLDRKVWITVGQFWQGNCALYSPTWAELREWSRRGITADDMQKNNRAGLNLHAWLTVDSGEIIEPSMMSTIATTNPKRYPHFRASMGWGKPDAIFSDHHYFPMAAGKAFTESIGEKSELGILASNTKELHTHSQALTFKGRAFNLLKS